MLRQFSTRRIVASVSMDIICTLGVLLLASYWRVRMGILPEGMVETIRQLQIPIRVWEISGPADTLQPAVFVLVALIWPLFFTVFYVYDGRYSANLSSELRNALMAIIASTLTLAGVLYFTYQETSRVLFVLFFLLDIIILLGARIAWWFYRTRIRDRGRPRAHSVLIVGAGAVGHMTAENLKRYAEGQVAIIGFVDDDSSKQNQIVCGFPVLGTLDQIPELIETHHVQDAVVALPLRAHERMLDICKRMQVLSVRIHVIPDLFALTFPSVSLDGFGGIPVIDLGRPGIFGWRRGLKRVFDVMSTMAALVLLWPIMLFIALLIRFDSKGPILYRQKRIGEHGAQFEMLKFRSMRVDTNERIHREHVTRLIQDNVSLDPGDASQNGSLKLTNDPRVTRVGRFIRKTSLDELPQLFNVLQGQMSLVGPRPPVPYEVELYQDWHKQRLEAIPGVTGLWQVKGRNRVSFDEMVRMDLDYIRRQSVWLDAQLLLLTPIALLRGSG